MPSEIDKRSNASHPLHESEILEVLLDVSQSLYQYITIDALIVHIVNSIKGFLNVEAVSVILYDEKRDEFVFRWIDDERIGDASNLEEFRFPTDQGIAGRVFASGEPELIPDISKDPRHFKKIDDLTRCRTKAMVVVPLRKKEKTIGVLEVINKKTGAFSDRDVSLLSTVSPIMAMALENASAAHIAITTGSELHI